MEETEHKCKQKGWGNFVPNNRFKIISWDVCFGGRVTGLMDYFKNGTPVKEGELITHVDFCPFCGEKAYTT